MGTGRKVCRDRADTGLLVTAAAAAARQAGEGGRTWLGTEKPVSRHLPACRCHTPACPCQASGGWCHGLTSGPEGDLLFLLWPPPSGSRGETMAPFSGGVSLSLSPRRRRTRGRGLGRRGRALCRHKSHTEGRKGHSAPPARRSRLSGTVSWTRQSVGHPQKSALP